MRLTRFLALPLVTVLFTSGIAVFAHSDTNLQSPMDQMMRQMMGAQTVETMEQMEDAMMGAENHERMETLVNKMLAGTLYGSEQQDMVRMMRDDQTGPGAMTMMMRMMMPALALRSGTEGAWLHQALEYGALITLVLLAATLVLLMLALVKWLKKSPWVAAHDGTRNSSDPPGRGAIPPWPSREAKEPSS